MVDPWEVEQRQYTRTLFVLRRVEKELRRLIKAGEAPHPAEVGGRPGLCCRGPGRRTEH